MKTALFLLSLLIFVSVGPLYAAAEAPAAASPEVAKGALPGIKSLYSDIESFDVAVYSETPAAGLSLETLLLRDDGNNERILARKVFPIESLPARVRVIKVGLWDVQSTEDGSYAVEARLLQAGKVISEARYGFVFGRQSIPKIHINDLVPNSEGISAVLSPKEPVVFDIEFMLINGSDVVYTTKTENVALLGMPQTFSAAWGTLLENDREYLGRIKVQLYSPKKDFVASTARFTAKDNAKITDIYEDEIGASATVLGQSQVPFDGSLNFTVFRLNETQPQESVLARVPVLLSGDDETVEVTWKERLPAGRYRLQIDLTGNSGELLEHREKVIESDLSASTFVSGQAGEGQNITQNITANKTEAGNESALKKLPGFSVFSGLGAVLFAFAALRAGKRE